MIAVWKHELRSYFHSLTAYVFGAGLLLAVGLGAMLYNIEAAVSNFEYALSYFSIIFAVIVPILTMRVIAEERKQKTDQLLYSLPITTTQVIVGKYLALLVVYLIPLCVVALYPLIFSQFGDVYLLTSYGSMLAFFLMGAALCVIILALGAVIKHLTKNETLAYGVCFVLVAAVGVTSFVNGGVFEGLLPNIMTKLSLFDRFTGFVNGVFDLTSIVYYASVIVFFLFLSIQSLEKRRYN